MSHRVQSRVIRRRERSRSRDLVRPKVGPIAKGRDPPEYESPDRRAGGKDIRKHQEVPAGR